MSLLALLSLFLWLLVLLFIALAPLFPGVSFPGMLGNLRICALLCPVISCFLLCQCWFLLLWFAARGCGKRGRTCCKRCGVNSFCLLSTDSPISFWLRFAFLSQRRPVTAPTSWVYRRTSSWRPHRSHPSVSDVWPQVLSSPENVLPACLEQPKTASPSTAVLPNFWRGLCLFIVHFHLPSISQGLLRIHNLPMHPSSFFHALWMLNGVISLDLGGRGSYVYLLLAFPTWFSKATFRVTTLLVTLIWIS